jgi:hypothetical protein
MRFLFSCGEHPSEKGLRFWAVCASWYLESFRQFILSPLPSFQKKIPFSSWAQKRPESRHTAGASPGGGLIERTEHYPLPPPLLKEDSTRSEVRRFGADALAGFT